MKQLLLDLFPFRTILDDAFLGEEREDFGVHVEVVGHNLLVTLLLGGLANGHLRGCTALGRVPSQSRKTQVVRLWLDLAQGPDHLAGNAWAFLVTVGDREANKKPNSFCVTSRDLGLEAVLLRLGLATICQRTDKEIRGGTLTIQPSFGGRMHR